MERRSKKHRRWGCLLAVCVLLAAILGVLWLRIDSVVSFVGSAATGGVLEVEGIEPGKVTRIARLRLSSPEPGRPVLSADNVRILLRPGESGRPIGAIEADSASLFLVRYGTNTNAGFLLPAADETRDAPPGPSRWLPESLQIASLGLALKEGAAPPIELEGLRLDARLSSLEELRVGIEAKALRASGMPGAGGTQQGSMTLALTRSADDLRADPIRAEIAGLFEAEAVARYVPSNRRFELDVAHFDACAGILTPWLALATNVPLVFDRVSLRDTQVFGVFAADSWQDLWVRLDATAGNLRAGPEEAPWWQGTLSAVGQFKEGTGQATLRPADAPEVALAIEGAWPEMALRAETAAWTPQQLAEHTPAFGGWVAGALPGLAELSIEAGCEGFDGHPLVQVKSAMNFHSGEAATLTFEGLLLPQEQGAGGTAVFSGSGAHVQGPVRITPTALEAELTFGHLFPQRIVSALFGGDLGLAESLSLSAFAVVSGHPNSPRAELDLKWHKFDYAALHIPASTAKGSLTYKNEELRVRLESAEYSHNLRLSPLRYDLARQRLVADAGLELTFDALPPLFDGDTLTGILTASADIQYSGKALWVDGKLAWQDPFTEAYQMRHESCAAGVRMEYSFVDHMAGISEIVLTLGGDENTRIKMGAGVISFGDAASSIPWRLDSTLAPLVKLGFLDVLEGGAASLEGRLERVEGAFQATAEGALSAERIESHGAAATNLSWAGHLGGSQRALHGQGSFEAASISFGPWGLDRAAAGVTAEHQSVRIEGFEAVFLGGTIRGHADLRLLTAKRPGSADLTLADIDLDAFSQRLDVDGVQLAGRAQGAGYIAWDADGLRDFQLLLEAPQGLTAGRALIEKLLLSDTLTAGLAASTVRVIREDILGNSETKDFDFARLDLDYRDARFVGPLELHSDNLNLTVDLVVEEGALFSAIKLGSEAGGGELSVSFE